MKTTKNYLVYTYYLNGTIEESNPLTFKGVNKIINKDMASDIIALEVKEQTIYNGLTRVNYLYNKTIIIDYLNNEQLINMFIVYRQLFNIFFHWDYERLERLEQVLYLRGGMFYAHIEGFSGDIRVIENLNYTNATHILEGFNGYQNYRLSIYWNRIKLHEIIES